MSAGDQVFLPRDEAVKKASEAIWTALGNGPMASDDGVQGFYRQIMGEGSGVSMKSFKLALGRLAHRSDGKLVTLTRDPQIDNHSGAARNMQLSRKRPNGRSRGRR